MGKGRTTAIDVLAAAGSKKLGTMLDALKAEIDEHKTTVCDLEHEEMLLMSALGLARARESEPNGRVTREEVVKAMRGVGSTGVTPKELVSLLPSGTELSKQAAHNHLSRLVEDGLASTDGRGTYVLSREARGPLWK